MSQKFGYTGKNSECSFFHPTDGKKRQFNHKRPWLVSSPRMTVPFGRWTSSPTLA